MEQRKTDELTTTASMGPSLGVAPDYPAAADWRLLAIYIGIAVLGLFLLNG